MLQVTKNSISNTAGIAKGCGSSQFCTTSYAFMTGADRSDASTSCCNTDNCTLPVTVPDKAANGFQCPFVFTSTNYSEHMLPCNGDQTKCFNITGASPAGVISSMTGCANDNYCKFLANMTMGSCRSATSSATSTTISPGLYSQGLLLLLGLFSVYASDRIINVYM
ncbi:phospholipase A2 inhibitor gamma subunit B-like [Dendropsophus ebraccatus]|uniref:phospholipase A2 inhibitor gamma subunit B-like n=1 Tax=Dendropsophus ebraccatus TaxID=150705 RepID=UPI003831C36F